MLNGIPLSPAAVVVAAVVAAVVVRGTRYVRAVRALRALVPAVPARWRARRGVAGASVRAPATEIVLMTLECLHPIG
jgi:hypothetical protein